MYIIMYIYIYNILCR